MTGIHRLQHIQRFAAAAFADDDPVGAHSQTVLDQVADSYRALAFDVRRPRLETHHVRLLKTQFRRVLHRDDALAVRNVARKEIEQSRLARTGAAGDDDVLSQQHA